VRCADAAQLAFGSPSLLTDWEHETATGIAHDRRREEWVAGRIAAKWLKLRHDATSTNATWPPPLEHASADELAAVSAARYQSVEVRRGDDGAPIFAGDAAPCVSIAHRSGWGVAALSYEGAVGIDLEAIGPRRPAFYDSTMSAAERRWMRGAAGSDAEYLGTLLWTLKEACLKTGASAAHTVWEIGAIDLDMTTPATEIAATWAKAAAGDGPALVDLPANLPLARGLDSWFQAAYGEVGGLVIGVVAERTSDFRGRGEMS
jgi:4'-phosphopantetheinyl transferase EntD